MSDRTRQILFIIGGTVAILTAALVIGLVTFSIVNGYVEVPEVTRNNFWGVVNFFLVSVLIPYLAYRMNELQQQARRTHERLKQTQQKTQEVQDRLENGIKTSLKRIEAATTGSTTIPGGRRATDPPVDEELPEAIPDVPAVAPPPSDEKDQE